MASIEFHRYQHHGSSVFGRWSFPLSILVNRISFWHSVARERRRLRSLDDDMLLDLGLSRRDAEHEAGRPFWDVDGLSLR